MSAVALHDIMTASKEFYISSNNLHSSCHIPNKHTNGLPSIHGLPNMMTFSRTVEELKQSIHAVYNQSDEAKKNNHIRQFNTKMKECQMDAPILWPVSYVESVGPMSATPPQCHKQYEYTPLPLNHADVYHSGYWQIYHTHHTRELPPQELTWPLLESYMDVKQLCTFTTTDLQNVHELLSQIYQFYGLSVPEHSIKTIYDHVKACTAHLVRFITQE